MITESTFKPEGYETPAPCLNVQIPFVDHSYIIPFTRALIEVLDAAIGDVQCEIPSRILHDYLYILRAMLMDEDEYHGFTEWKKSKR